jgi:hypothetical protein
VLTLVLKEPTASHSWAEEHDTAPRLMKVAQEGAWMGCDVQDDPFQIALPVATGSPATAMQKLDETHDTAPPPPGIAC